MPTILLGADQRHWAPALDLCRCSRRASPPATSPAVLLAGYGARFTPLQRPLVEKSLICRALSTVIRIVQPPG